MIIQESKANDLLELDVKKETESNKKKLNAFDMFPTKPQTSNLTPSNTYQNQNNQTHNLDIFDGENPQTNESIQNPESKRKFKFANKTPQTTAEQNILDQPKEQHVVKQNKFDPFSMNSSKPQEKPQVVAHEDKKKAFGFIKKPEKDNGSSLLDLNLREEKGLNNLNINNVYSSEIKVANNINNNMINLQQGMTTLTLTPKTQTSNLMNISPPNQNKANTPSPNLNQKSQLDNLYNSFPQQNLNPMTTNYYYSQMNNPQPGMNYMNMGPMNMGPMNHGPMNNGSMNMGAMNNMGAMMGPMNMGSMNMNMGPMNPMNMGAMNMGIGMGPMNMGMGMGPMNMGMGGNMGMNATVGMNLMNSNGVGDMAKTLEKEKKEPPKKVLDESAFDFIKF